MDKDPAVRTASVLFPTHLTGGPSAPRTRDQNSVSLSPASGPQLLFNDDLNG